MTQQQHPIIPPDELVRHWSRFQGDTNPEALWFRIANEAAQWGADQELEACCEWLKVKHWLGIEPEFADELRSARRPKPQSLKEQSIALFDLIQEAQEPWQLTDEDLDVVRRALESIPDPS
jgi:hypothetical protein